MKRLAILFAALLFASAARADFGQYESHTLNGNTLTIESSVGALRITAVDDAAFEVHYVEDGVRQLPSFALAPVDDDHAIAVEDTDDRLTLRIEGLEAVVEKSGMRIAYFRDGQPLVAEHEVDLRHDAGRLIGADAPYRRAT